MKRIPTDELKNICSKYELDYIVLIGIRDSDGASTLTSYGTTAEYSEKANELKEDVGNTYFGPEIPDDKIEEFFDGSYDERKPTTDELPDGFIPGDQSTDEIPEEPTDGPKSEPTDESINEIPNEPNGPADSITDLKNEPTSGITIGDTDGPIETDYVPDSLFESISNGPTDNRPTSETPNEPTSWPTNKYTETLFNRPPLYRP